MRATGSMTCTMYDYQGHRVEVTRAAILAEMAMREQAEALPF
jgi:hypothetical protein